MLPARGIKLAVVLVTGDVVVVAQQMGGRGGDEAGGREDLHLDASSSSSIPVTEIVNPSDVEMGDDCLDNRVGDRHLLIRRVELLVQPFTKSIQQVVAVLARWREVSTNGRPLLR